MSPYFFTLQDVSFAIDRGRKSDVRREVLRRINASLEQDRVDAVFEEFRYQLRTLY